MAAGTMSPTGLGYRGPTQKDLEETWQGTKDAYTGLRDADQATARAINENVLGGLPILPVGEAPVDPAALPPAPVDPTALPPPPAALPPPPAGGGGGTGIDVKTSRVVLTPEAKKQLATGRDLSEGQLEANQDAATADQLSANANSKTEQKIHAAQKQQADEDLVTVQKAEAQRLEKERIYGEASIKAQDKIKLAEKDVEDKHKARQRDYYDDSGYGTQILHALLSGMAVYGQVLAGKDPNAAPVLQIINKSKEDYKQKKLADYLRSKEFLEEARKGPAQAREAYQEATQLIEAGALARINMTLKKAKALEANAKDPETFRLNLDAANAHTVQESYKNAQGMVDTEVGRAMLGAKTVTTSPTPWHAGQSAGQIKAGKNTLANLDGSIKGEAKSASLANKAAEQLKGALESQRLSEELKQEILKEGMGGLVPGFNGRRVQIENNLASALLLARTGKAASPGEHKRIKAIITPSGLNQATGSRQDSADHVQKFVDEEIANYKNTVNSYLITPDIGPGATTPAQEAGRGAAKGAPAASAPSKPTHSNAEKLRAAIRRARADGNVAAVEDLEGRLRATPTD